jgi:hypothetical protein
VLIINMQLSRFQPTGCAANRMFDFKSEEQLNWTFPFFDIIGVRAWFDDGFWTYHWDRCLENFSKNRNKIISHR